MHMTRSTVLTATTHVSASDAPRCKRTMLTKPECHCPTCLAEQISAYGRGAEFAPEPAAGSS
jgi:hypothetical protein